VALVSAMAPAMARVVTLEDADVGRALIFVLLLPFKLLLLLELLLQPLLLLLFQLLEFFFFLLV